MPKGLRIKNKFNAVQIDSDFKSMRAIFEDLDLVYLNSLGYTFNQSGAVNYIPGGPIGAPQIVMISPSPGGPPFKLWDVQINLTRIPGFTSIDFRMTNVAPGTINFSYRVFTPNGDFLRPGNKGLRILNPDTLDEIIDSRRTYIRVREQIALPPVDGFFGWSNDGVTIGSYQQPVSHDAYEGKRVWYSMESFGVCNVGGNPGGRFTNSRRVHFISPASIHLDAVRVLIGNQNPVQYYEPTGQDALLIAAN